MMQAIYRQLECNLEEKVLPSLPQCCLARGPCVRHPCPGPGMGCASYSKPGGQSPYPLVCGGDGPPSMVVLAVPGRMGQAA